MPKLLFANNKKNYKLAFNLIDFSAMLKPPDRKSFHMKLWGMILLTSIVIVFIYVPSLKNQLTKWDDNIYILENPLIKNMNFNTLKQQFKTFYLGNYHPITMISFSFDYKIGKTNPVHYHITNLTLHVLNSLMIFCFIFMLLNFNNKYKNARFLVASITALLFGIHAINVELVVWIAERKNVLYTFFFMGSLILYLTYLKKSQLWLLGTSLLFFILSCFSKGMAVSLPLTLIVIDFFIDRKLLSKKVIIEKIPFFIFAIVFGIISIIAQQSSKSITSQEYSLPAQIAFASKGFIQYLMNLFLPVRLSAYYPYPLKINDSIPSFYYIFPIIVVILIGLIIYFIRNYKGFWFGFGFFLVNIIFVLQLLPVGNALMADRYVYVSSIGFFFLIALFTTWCINRIPPYKGLIYSILGLYCIILTFLSLNRVKIWKDDLTLYSDIISKYNYRSYDLTKIFNNRGNILYDLGRYREAISDYSSIITERPNYSDAYTNRASAKIQIKDYNGALNDLNYAIKLDIKDSLAFLSRGVVKKNIGDFNGAINDFDKALDLNPAYIEAYINRANVYANLKDYKSALTDFEKAVLLKPNYYKIYFQRGLMRINMKDYQAALKDLSKSIELKRTFPCLMNRGVVYINLNNILLAIKDFTEALQLEPDNINAYINRSNAYHLLKEDANALNDINTVIFIDPTYIPAYLTRGIIKTGQGDYSNAIKDLEKVTKIYSHRMAFYYLGIAYLKSGNLPEGCKNIKKARDLGYKINDPDLIKKCR